MNEHKQNNHQRHIDTSKRETKTHVLSDLIQLKDSEIDIQEGDTVIYDDMTVMNRCDCGLHPLAVIDVIMAKASNLIFTVAVEKCSCGKPLTPKGYFGHTLSLDGTEVDMEAVTKIVIVSAMKYTAAKAQKQTERHINN